MGWIYRICREFDEDHNGNIDPLEFKKMVEFLKKGKTLDYDSDEERQIWADRQSGKYGDLSDNV